MFILPRVYIILILSLIQSSKLKKISFKRLNKLWDSIIKFNFTSYLFQIIIINEYLHIYEDFNMY